MSAKLILDAPQLPSEKIIAKQKAQLKDHVIDSDGRVIKLRMPDALDEFDLSSALGHDSSNMGCAAMANSLLYVESIDAFPFIQPKSLAQIRAGIKKVGTPGMRAIADALTEYSKEQNLLTEQEQMNAIKK